MEYRAFGRTGMEISALGIGCWEIGGGYGSIVEADFSTAVNRALDLGITCFDTAEAYGRGASERALAKALGARRGAAVITTKFGVGYPDALNGRDSSRQRVMAAVEQSLTNLQTDYLDVYLVHWPDVHTPFEETMRALEDLVQHGKVRAVGISNFRLTQLQTTMQARRVDVAQYGWNLFDRRMQAEILPYCRAQGIGVMAYGSLAYGLLSGTLTAATDFGADDWRARRGRMGSLNLFQHIFGPEHFAQNLRVVEELRGLAQQYGKTLPQLALRWTLSNPAVSTALVGCRTAAEVDDNVGALGWSLSAAALQEIDAIFARQGVNPVPEGWLESE